MTRWQDAKKSKRQNEPSVDTDFVSKRYYVAIGLVSFALLIFVLMRLDVLPPFISTPSETETAVSKKPRGPISSNILSSSLPALDSTVPADPSEVIEEARLIADWMSASLPGDPDAHELQARMQYWLGKQEDAAKLWERCLQQDPNYVHAHYGLGIVANDLGDYKKAVKHLSNAVLLAKDVAIIRQQLAHALMSNGDFERATAVLKESLEYADDKAQVAETLGIAFRQLEQYNEARQWLETALQSNPDKPSLHVALAGVYAHLKNDDKVQEHTKRGRELMRAARQQRLGIRNEHDDFPRMLRKLAAMYTTAGDVCRDIGQHRTSEALWRRATVVSKTDIDSRRMLYSAYRKTSQLNEATAVLRELIELQPDQTELRQELVELYIKTNRLSDAEETLKQLVIAQPTSTVGHRGLIRLYLQSQNKLDRAYTLANQAVAIEPIAQNYFLLAQTSHGQGKLDEARAAMAKAVSLAPNNTEYRRVMQELQK